MLIKYGGIKWIDSTKAVSVEVPEEVSAEVPVKVSGTILDHEKCTKQLVLNVNKNVKFHSNLQKASLFIVENALEKEEDFRFLDAQLFNIFF